MSIWTFWNEDLDGMRMERSQDIVFSFTEGGEKVFLNYFMYFDSVFLPELLRVCSAQAAQPGDFCRLP